MDRLLSCFSCKSSICSFNFSASFLSEIEQKIENIKLNISYWNNAIKDHDSEHDPESLGRVNQRIERIERGIKVRHEQEQVLRNSITKLTAKLDTNDARGLNEKIAETQRDRNFYQERKKRYERDIQVFELLVSTLREAEMHAKEKFMQPVLKKVNPYLQYLFPNSEIKLDEKLDITDVVRDQEQENYEQLSMGTQEQIAVLIRLAFAELLADKGIPVSVVLDDALVYSDDMRMDLMFDILLAAAKKNQIIVLTCRETLFQGLTDDVFSLKPSDNEALRSA